MDIKYICAADAKCVKQALWVLFLFFFPSPVQKIIIIQQSPHNLGRRVSQGAGWPHFLLLSMGNFLFGAWLSALLLLLLLLVPLTLAWWAFRQKHIAKHVKGAKIFLMYTSLLYNEDYAYRMCEKFRGTNTLVKLVYPAP